MCQINQEFQRFAIPQCFKGNFKLDARLEIKDNGIIDKINTAKWINFFLKDMSGCHLKHIFSFLIQPPVARFTCAKPMGANPQIECPHDVKVNKLCFNQGFFQRRYY